MLVKGGAKDNNGSWAKFKSFKPFKKFQSFRLRPSAIGDLCAESAKAIQL